MRTILAMLVMGLFMNPVLAQQAKPKPPIQVGPAPSINPVEDETFTLPAVTLHGKLTKDIQKLPRGKDSHDQFMGYLLTVPTNVGTPIASQQTYHLVTKDSGDEKLLEKLVGKTVKVDGLSGNRSFQSYIYVIGVDETVEVARRDWHVFAPFAVEKLTVKQREIFVRHQRHVATKAITVVRLNNLYRGAEFAKVVNIQFTLGGTTFVIPNCHGAAGKISYEGKLANGSPVSVALTVRDTAVTGLIYHGGNVFVVEPLGDWVVAIVQVDQTKFPRR